MDARTIPDDVELTMAREHLDDVPVFELPAGYRILRYEPGDEDAWTDIQRVADLLNVIDDGLFKRQYGPARDALPERMWFVVTDAGEPIGTISSWWEHGPERPDDRGRIHWVAVRPEHQRRGISKPMMTVALQAMAKHHTAAMLGTSSGRPWAAKVYLDCGFVPERGDLLDPVQLAAWRGVQRIIDHPVLRPLLASCCR